MKVGLCFFAVILSQKRLIANLLTLLTPPFVWSNILYYRKIKIACHGVNGVFHKTLGSFILLKSNKF